MRRTTALALLAVMSACDAGEKKPVEIKNGIRMTFSLAQGSPDAAAAVMQKRLDGANVTGKARAEDGVIVVDLAIGKPEAVWNARELITRVGKLDVSIVDDGNSLMRDLAKVIREATGARERGIRDEVDHWRTDSGETHDDVCFRASDREEEMSIDEAKKRGCYRATVGAEAGSARCVVSGREQLERFVIDTALLHNLTIPDDHAMAYQRVVLRSDATAVPYWRSYYVHRASALGTDAIASARVSSDAQTNAPIVETKLKGGAAKAFGELTRANVGKKLALILDGNVASAPIIMSAITTGRLVITLGGDARDGDAAVIASALASGPLPGPVREETAFELKDGKVITPSAY